MNNTIWQTLSQGGVRFIKNFDEGVFTSFNPSLKLEQPDFEPWRNLAKLAIEYQFNRKKQKLGRPKSKYIVGNTDFCVCYCLINKDDSHFIPEYQSDYQDYLHDDIDYRNVDFESVEIFRGKQIVRFTGDAYLGEIASMEQDDDDYFVLVETNTTIENARQILEHATVALKLSQ